MRHALRKFYDFNLDSVCLRISILSRIPTSLNSIVYCTAIRWGGAKEWNFLHELRNNILHEDAKYTILDALGCTRDFGRLML